MVYFDYAGGKEYRTLHQTVWPGVVDQVARSNNRNLSIFLVELGADLVEFLYVEYVGDDQVRDDAMSKADPVNIRWWKHTGACQKPLPGTNDTWDMMDAVGAE